MTEKANEIPCCRRGHPINKVFFVKFHPSEMAEQKTDSEFKVKLPRYSGYYVYKNFEVVKKLHPGSMQEMHDSDSKSVACSDESISSFDGPCCQSYSTVSEVFSRI